MLHGAQKVGYWVRNSKFWLFASSAFFFLRCLYCCDLPRWNESKINRSSASDQRGGCDWTCPSVPASDYLSAGRLLYGAPFLKLKVKLIGIQWLEKKDSPFKIISWKPKNLLNSLESEEMWGHKLTTRRIYSQIQGCVREAALGHLGILNLAQNSEFWDNWVLITVVISLKCLLLFALLCPKLVSPPPLVFCPFKLPQSQSSRPAAGHGDGGQLLPGSSPWKGAECQAEGGKPDRELQPPSQPEHRGKGMMVGLNDLKGLKVWSILNTAMILCFMTAKVKLTQAAHGCVPVPSTGPNSLSCAGWWQPGADHWSCCCHRLHHPTSGARRQQQWLLHLQGWHEPLLVLVTSGCH